MKLEEIIKIVNDLEKEINDVTYLEIQGLIRRYLKNNGIKYSKDDLDALTYEAHKLITTPPSPY